MACQEYDFVQTIKSEPKCDFSTIFCWLSVCASVSASLCPVSIRTYMPTSAVSSPSVTPPCLCAGRMFEFPEDLHRAWCSIITAATSKQNWKKGELDPKTKRPLEMRVCKVRPGVSEAGRRGCRIAYLALAPLNTNHDHHRTTLVIPLPVCQVLSNSDWLVALDCIAHCTYGFG